MTIENQQNRKAQFDIIKLEELYQRKNLNHSIEKHHKVEFYILLFIVFPIKAFIFKAKSNQLTLENLKKMLDTPQKVIELARELNIKNVPLR